MGGESCRTSAQRVGVDERIPETIELGQGAGDRKENVRLTGNVAERATPSQRLR